MDSSKLLAELAKRYADLGHWVEIDGRWLNGWTIAVVVGVVIELWIISSEYISELRDFRRGTIRSPERPRKVKFAVELLSAALVIIGIVGEFCITRSTGEKETEMRAISGKQLSIAESEASKANLQAAQLLSEIQPRDLTPEERHDLESMRRFAGHNLLIASILFDTEGARLARQLKSSLNKAGIGTGNDFETMTLDRIGGYPEIMTGLWGATPTGSVIRSGIAISGTDRAAVPALQQILSKYLKEVSAPSESDDPFANSPQKLTSQVALIVFVGSKPIPEDK